MFKIGFMRKPVFSYFIGLLGAGFFLLLLDCVVGRLVTADELKLPARVDFARDIQPIFQKHCYFCHGQDVQEGGIRFDRKSNVLQGGDSGPLLVSGKPDDSLLVAMVSGNDAEGRVMPPQDQAPALSAEQVQFVRRWIEQGASWPDTAEDVQITAGNLWSLKPVVRPGIPPVKNAEWVRNPIDAFVLYALEQHGMEPTLAAPPLEMARRASLDLTGLPLTLDELTRFEAENEKNPEQAYSDLIESLLASQHYGERWGRHWLDIVRYADSNGYEVDGEKPMAWKYRDYVIKSLNEDKPYDRFVLEQLAGDELKDATSETVIATGFIRVGPWDAERGASVQPSEVLEELFNELDDRVSTTSQVFLGLTMGCARCHDHKFDPISTEDYYSLVAVFRSLTRERKGRSELTRPAVPPKELKEKNAADADVTHLKSKIQELDAPLRVGLLEIGETKLPEDAVVAFQVEPDQRTDEQKQRVQRFQSKFDKVVEKALKNEELSRKYLSDTALKEIVDARSKLIELQERFSYPQGYFLHESSPTAPDTHLLKRGNPTTPGKVVNPAVPAAITKRFGQEPPSFEEPDEFTSRRRISLAHWIVRKDNPLTTRVIVNRVWQYHFGEGLVRTPSDFGNRGAAPIHPELLDWLADWFVNEADWSLKELHRLVMDSSTYRMGKQFNREYAERDPDNLGLWRFPYQRLEVEAIRDSMLAVSGQLNRQLYGPSMYPKIPEDALQSGYDPQGVWKEFDEKEASRRTIYAYLKRTLVVPFLDTLDFCDTTTSIGRRDITTVAPQALELLNGEFVNRQAAHFAKRLLREAGPEVGEQIVMAYRLALGRRPTADEQETLMEFVASEASYILEQSAVEGGKNPSQEESHRQALTQMCRILFNLNEFVYTD